MATLEIRYSDGVRVGQIAFDPQVRVPVALWTHRPERRPPAGRVLAAEPLARNWTGAIGLPFGHGGVALGQRVELLPTAYGTGGCAALLTLEGRRTLVVGPTTESLTPRRAERLVLFVPRPAAPPCLSAEALQALIERANGEPLVVPDAAAAERLAGALTEADVPFTGPRWLPGTARRGATRIALSGSGYTVDARPQASPAWLADFITRVSPRSVRLHGPGTERVLDALARLSPTGLPPAEVRVFCTPDQMALPGTRVAPAREGA